MLLFSCEIPWVPDTDFTVIRDDDPTPVVAPSELVASAAPVPKIPRVRAPSAATTTAHLVYRRMIRPSDSEGRNARRRRREAEPVGASAIQALHTAVAAHCLQNRLPREGGSPCRGDH